MKKLFFAIALLAVGCGGRSSAELPEGWDASTVDGSSPDASADSSADSSADTGGADSSSDASVLDSSMDSALLDASVDSSFPPPNGQKILFEISTINSAWGEQVSGYYVTVQGEVYSYDYYKASPDAGKPFTGLVAGMSESQVVQKHGSAPKYLLSIDKTELLAKFALVASARRGMLLAQMLCADYGLDRFVAYTYDEASSTYSPVILGVDGDFAQKNTAAEADALVTWLLSKTKSNTKRFCEYRARPCAAVLCPGVAPCQKGTVPGEASASGCALGCISPDTCESVANCNVCVNAKAACLIDPDGAYHCARWLLSCSSGAIDCSCGGTEICAAGASSCQGTSSQGISCSSL